ncbi:MAG: exodeoxyribonuclease VII large subunit, partial [Candidatus Paceibacterota bacterium]
MKEEKQIEEIRPLDAISVSNFLDAVNLVLATGSPVVFGEVAEFKASEKWVSFSLRDKDDGATLKCAMSIWDFRRLGVQLEDGMEIKVSGRPRVTKKYGSLSFWVSSIEPLGQGSLKKAYDLLVKKMQADGLFARKRDLPKIIYSVGIITSKTGAVIHDFLKNLEGHNINLFLYDSRVEGQDAPEDLVSGLRFFNERKPVDIIVLIRGGGGLESMQAFNNENVCREIFASKIPVLCGIGHDVDVPIACMVADLSVSTPTAAAHVINGTWNEIKDNVVNFGRQFFYYADRTVENRLSHVKILAGKIVSGAQKYIDLAINFSLRLQGVFIPKMETTITESLLRVNSASLFFAVA